MAEPTPEEIAHMRTSFDSFLHNASIGTLIIAPVIIALPPRKLDFYTFSLAGSFCLAGSHLYSERQTRLGRERTGDWMMPAKAREKQMQMQQRRLLDDSTAAIAGRRPVGGGGSLLEEKAKEVWMGGETEGWKERRLIEERQKLAEGHGYWDLITDQIWEVWNWGDKKAEGLNEKDEIVVAKEKKEEARKQREEQRAREFPKIGKD